MTRQDAPPLVTLSGAFLVAQWDRVGHITLSDRCRRPVGRENKKNRHVSFLGHAPSRERTAVLKKFPHSNSCKRVPNRPLRPRRGRFGTLLH